ncbi:hypothetical protein POL58_14220 [Nannocystis sp. ncelm1]|uniref:Uncharacterized protein n=1 Tax=Nannocystis radixulma TaxID=2995305 RepID=A0ABT5B5G0_9BACT|nr:hypothetical protein [Nannocystis radixulma]MDC0668905.1 hypothetical protein [Nannocystis radixulma]
MAQTSLGNSGRILGVRLVDDDDAGGSGLQRPRGLGLVRAAAAVEEEDGALHVADERLAAVGRVGAAGVLAAHERGGDVELGEAEDGGARRERLRQRLHREVDDLARALVRHEPHARRGAVERGPHAGVVLVADERAVLVLDQHGVAVFAAAAVVVELTGAGGLDEAGVVPPVVQPVDDVEGADDPGHRLRVAGHDRLADVVGVIEHAGGGDGGADPVGDRVLVLGIAVGVDVVADGGHGAVRQPWVRLTVGVGVEAVDRHQHGGLEALGQRAGEAGRVRVEVGERAVERVVPWIVGRVDSVLIGRVGDGAAPHEQATVVGGDDVLIEVVAPVELRLHLDEVGGDQVVADGEVDRSHARGLAEAQPLVAGHGVTPPAGAHVELDEGSGPEVAVEVAQGRRDRGRGGELERLGAAGMRGGVRCAGDSEQTPVAVEQELDVAVKEVDAADCLTQGDDDAAAPSVVDVERARLGEHRRGDAVGRGVARELPARGSLERERSGWWLAPRGPHQRGDTAPGRSRDRDAAVHDPRGERRCRGRDVEVGPLTGIRARSEEREDDRCRMCNEHSHDDMLSRPIARRDAATPVCCKPAGDGVRARPGRA